MQIKLSPVVLAVLSRDLSVKSLIFLAQISLDVKTTTRTSGVGVGGGVRGGGATKPL